MEGKKVLSDVQYVINLNKNNQDFDIETFNKLPEDEQFKIASDIMAKNKCFVTKLDDLILEEEVVEPFEFEMGEPSTEQAPVLENWEKVGAEENTKAAMLSDDEIILPVEEVKVKKSTAKKIKA